MFVQQVTTQLQYLALQYAGLANERPDAEEPRPAQQPAVAGFDRIELSAWAISISREALGLIGPGDVAEQVEDPRQSPRELISELRSTIDGLKQEGKISRRRARHLDRILDLALRNFENGRFRRANRLMLHFSRHIERLAQRDRVSEESAQTMIDSARDFVQQLRTERHSRWMAARAARQSESQAITIKAGVMLFYAEFHSAPAE
jgi:hypothetical protein